MFGLGKKDKPLFEFDLEKELRSEPGKAKELIKKTYKKQTYIFMKSRKRIETLFSQLCDQFMIRRNYAKSFPGFKTRILAKKRY